MPTWRSSRRTAPTPRGARALICDGPHGAARFYDLDTPVTLAGSTRASRCVPAADGLGAFDLVLSYTGGARSTRSHAARAPARGAALRQRRPRRAPPAARARGVALRPLVHRHVRRDRQAGGGRALPRARARAPGSRFVLPARSTRDFAWAPNVWYLAHLPPADHPAFYASVALTLNVTRGAMAAMGWCPSGRLFEAAACGVPILTDAWPGLDAFFTAGRGDPRGAGHRRRARAPWTSTTRRSPSIARRARERTLDEHTAARAREAPAGARAGPASGRDRTSLARSADHVAASFQPRARARASSRSRSRRSCSRSAADSRTASSGRAR
jgi:hypothetical protein